MQQIIKKFKQLVVTARVETMNKNQSITWATSCWFYSICDLNKNRMMESSIRLKLVILKIL